MITTMILYYLSHSFDANSGLTTVRLLNNMSDDMHNPSKIISIRGLQKLDGFSDGILQSSLPGQRLKLTVNVAVKHSSVSVDYKNKKVQNRLRVKVTRIVSIEKCNEQVIITDPSGNTWFKDNNECQLSRKLNMEQ